MINNFWETFGVLRTQLLVFFSIAFIRLNTPIKISAVRLVVFVIAVFISSDCLKDALLVAIFGGALFQFGIELFSLSWILPWSGKTFNWWGYPTEFAGFFAVLLSYIIISMFDKKE